MREIHLLDNPLLHEPPALEHITPRLLGHRGTTAGRTFIYALIARDGLSAIYVVHPGAGKAPATACGWVRTHGR